MLWPTIQTLDFYSRFQIRCQQFIGELTFEATEISFDEILMIVACTGISPAERARHLSEYPKARVVYDVSHSRQLEEPNTR